MANEPIDNNITSFLTEFNELCQFYWLDTTTTGVNSVLYCRVDADEPVKVCEAPVKAGTALNSGNANAVFLAYNGLEGDGTLRVIVYDYSTTPPTPTEYVSSDRGTTWKIFDTHYWES